MTGGSWATWVGGAAATIAVLTFFWHRVVRPLVHGLRRCMELLDRLMEVLDGWPQIQASTLTTEGELTALAIQLGEMGGEVARAHTDVDNAFERLRSLEADTHTHPRRASHAQST